MRDATARQLDAFIEPPPRKPRVLRTPDIRVIAPSRPNKASERGADFISPLRRPSWRKILNALANLPEGRSLSREQLSERTGVKETSMCGRLHELSNLKIRVAGSEESVTIEAVEDACISKAGIQVTGYRLSAAGRGLFEERR